jgi:nitrogen-specific signal transduction histidine kinase
MSRHEPTPLPSGMADAVLDALPHPVIMVGADGKIGNANAAAESFFDASLPLLRRHVLTELACTRRPGARPRRRRQRIQGRSRYAAQSG